MNKKYQHAILGGTFDHFHLGHEFFLRTAVENSLHLAIGLTVEEMHSHKDFAESIQSYDVRKSAVERFLVGLGHEGKFTISPLGDIYGTTLEDEAIDGLFVTEHGMENAKIINEKRQELGWGELSVELVDFIRGEDGEIISSTRIRSGEIDRSGNVYIRMFLDDLKIPLSVVDQLQTPWGEVLKNDQDITEYLKDSRFIFAVGDITTQLLFKLKISPTLSIIDFQTKRSKIDPEEFGNISLSNIKITNPPGAINSDAVVVLDGILNENIQDDTSTVVVVEGEEDLLALPLLLLAPIQSILCYGLRDQGLVAVRVTEEVKLRALELVKKLERVSR